MAFAPGRTAVRPYTPTGQPVSYSLFSVPCISPLHAGSPDYSLFPIPCSLFSVPCVLPLPPRQRPARYRSTRRHEHAAPRPCYALVVSWSAGERYMRFPLLRTLGTGGALLLTCLTISAKDRRPPTAQIAVETGREACRAELDSVARGATNAKGSLLISDVEPGDHYLHVLCPGAPEAVYFLSAQAAQTTAIQVPRDNGTAASVRDPSVIAANKIELNQLVPKAVQLRAQGRLDEAAAAFRQALALDPENSDLHRELGITFLLGKEWKRARVEMIEAIRHDRNSADAHNGLGYALEKLGDLDGALQEYRTATHIEPDDPTYSTHYIDTLVKISARQEKKKEH